MSNEMWAKVKDAILDIPGYIGSDDRNWAHGYADGLLIEARRADIEAAWNASALARTWAVARTDDRPDDRPDVLTLSEYLNFIGIGLEEA